MAILNLRAVTALAPAMLLVFLIPTNGFGGQVYQLGQIYAEPFPSVVAQSQVVASAGTFKYASVVFPPGQHVLQFDVIDDLDPTTYVYVMDEQNLSSFLRSGRGQCIATPCGEVARSHTTTISVAAQTRAYILVDNRNGVMLPARVVFRELQPGGEQGFLMHWDAKMRLLQSILQIPTFPIVFKRCGFANAFADAKGITMCYELYWELQKSLGETRLANSAYQWTLYHELGHALLFRFNLPAYSNEEYADEFAAFLAVLLNEEDSILASAEFFARNGSVLEAIRKSFKDDRHPLSAQRARNLYSWLASPGPLISRWHTAMLKHFRTEYLRTLLASPHMSPLGEPH